MNRCGKVARGEMFFQLQLKVAVLFAIVSVAKSQNPSLAILSSGIILPHTQDIVLRFYIMVENKGSHSLNKVSATSEKCCLQDSPTEGVLEDCQSMLLMGGELPILQPQEQKNLTLIYPTMYVFDRAGDCDLAIQYTSVDQKLFSVKHSLHFNTSLTDSLWMPNVLKGWLTGLQDCESVDQDRQRNCEPVNCVLKYRGQRNFYNTTRKRCEPATICLSTPGKSLPDRAYRRRMNSCKDIGEKISDDDLKYLAGDLPATPYKDVDLMHIYQYVCVHGMEKPDRSGCICSAGWTTLAVDHSAYDPNTHMYRMCNVRDIGAMALLKYKGTRITLIVLGSMCAALLIIVVALGFYSCYDRQRQVNTTPLPPPDACYQPLNPSNTFSLMHDSFKPPRSSRKPDKDDPAAEYESARVHTPNMPMLEGELDLRIGDIITDLRRSTSTQGMWKGTCNGVEGIFPVSCAELYQKGQGPRPVHYD